MIRLGFFLTLLLVSGSPLPAYSADEQLQPAEDTAVEAEELPPVEQAAPAPKAEEAPPEKSEATAPSEEPTPVTHSPILPVKIKPIQEGADGVSKAGPDIEHRDEVDPDTLTLYASQADGSLGPDLWKGLSRQEVLDGLSKIPAPQYSPVQRELLIRMLLTRSSVEASKAEPPAPELFTIRMKKLIEVGAYEEAMKLYEKLESPTTSADAALAGMQAFIANGQLAIACLEQKALDDKLKTDAPFWKHLDTFCNKYIKTEGESGDVSQGLMNASIAYSQSEKILVPTKFEDLNDRSLVELMVLSKSGTLDHGKWTVATASTLNPSVIGFLLAMEPGSTDQRLSLLTVAVAHGIKTPADLDAAYKGIGVARGEWGSFITNPKNFSAAATLKTQLSKASQFTPAAYTPFASSIADVQPTAPLEAEDARIALQIFIAAATPIPVGWVNLAYGTEFDRDSGESALLNVWAPVPEGGKDAKKASSQEKAGKQPVSPEFAYASVLKDFLTDDTGQKTPLNDTYDNFLSLTGSGNYVMPSGELTENLKKAAQARHLGKVLLYSLQALNGQKADKVHPVPLFEVLKALKTAGLSEETVSLAREALVGLTTKKEN